MVSRPSYLHNGISYTGKMTSLYWIRTQVAYIECPNFMTITSVTISSNREPMMTSSNGNILRFTGPLWGESTSGRWIPLKGQWWRALMFLWSARELTVEQTIETPVIGNAIALIMTPLLCSLSSPQLYHSSTSCQSDEWPHAKTTFPPWQQSIVFFRPGLKPVMTEKILDKDRMEEYKILVHYLVMVDTFFSKDFLLILLISHCTVSRYEINRKKSWHRRSG